YAGVALYASRSRDGGQHFDPEYKVADHSCECCRTTLERTPQGEVASLFRSVYGDNIRDHSYAVLPRVDGAVVPQRATFSQWQVAACPDQGPGLAIGRDGVRHAVWYEASHGPAIWYGQLNPGHQPKHKLKIGGAGASHADVAAQGKTVWVVWNQVSAKGYTLMLRTSNDHGDSFASPRALATSSVAAYSPQLLVHNGRAYVAWNTLDGFRLMAVTVK
ncbi:MAG: exo-alpha-sialidase, partial [Xanthomonadales bacterium]|nr:exo-alpha-sialidase [Xanthomonadales bacterium]